MAARRTVLILVVAAVAGIVIAVAVVMQGGDSPTRVTDSGPGASTEKATLTELASPNAKEQPRVVSGSDCALMPTWGRQSPGRSTNFTLRDARELSESLDTRVTFERGRCLTNLTLRDTRELSESLDTRGTIERDRCLTNLTLRDARELPESLDTRVTIERGRCLARS